MAISRRSLLIGAGALGAAGVLSACGDRSDGDAGGGGDEISVLTPAFALDHQRQVWDGLVTQFNEQHPDVTVTTDHTAWDKLNEKLTATTAAGITADVVMTGVGWVEQYANRGIFASLDETAVSTLDYSDQVLTPCRFDGDLYALPLLLDTRSMIGNRALWDAAGITEPPTTFDEFREVAKELTVGSGDTKQWGIVLNSVGSPASILTSAIGANDARMFSDDGNTSLLDTPECIEAMEFLVGLITDGSTSWDLRPAEGSPHPFLTGKFGMSLMPDFHWQAWSEGNPELIESDEGSVMFRWQNDRESIFLGGTLVSRSATSQNPGAADQFIQFLCGADSVQQVCELHNATPPSQDVVDNSETLSSNRFVSFGVEGLPYASSEGGSPTYLEIRGQITPVLEEAFVGQRDAESAMVEAHRIAQEIIDRDS